MSEPGRTSCDCACDACVIPSEEFVDALIERWTSSLRTGDPDAVLANFAEGAVLLPTFASAVITDRSERREYFTTLLARDPTCVVRERTIFATCNSATAAGRYDFHLGDGTVAHARFSFTFGRVDGDWKILTQHSSIQPE